MNIATERLLLREVIEDDWTSILAYQKKPEYLRYYEWKSRSEKDVRDFVDMFLEQQGERPRLRWQLAVELKASGRLVGTCGIRTDTADAVEGDIGFELDPDFWGKGYASEAAAAILRFGFEDLALHRIWAWCVEDNLGSIHVLEKLGMKQEARLREKQFYKGRLWNHLVYAMLDREWKAMTTGE
jgi:ribosomal-protein-alanine N-acetyltransferase